MRTPEGSPEPPREAAVRDHLANERTFLAWERTALALLGVGFVVDRFALENQAPSSFGGVLGVALVIAGGAVALVGIQRYVRTERQIDAGVYRPALVPHLLLTGIVVLAAVGLFVYLAAAAR